MVMNRYCHFICEPDTCPKEWTFENGWPVFDNCCEICPCLEGDFPNTTSDIRNELVDHLKGNVCKVTFTKVNGSERTMTVTLIPELLPPSIDSDGKKQAKWSDQTIRCFELDLQEWRSFRIDSLTKFTFL